MSIESEKLRGAKEALRGMSSKGRGELTKREFVASLINDIHAKMQAGFKMDEICEEINNTLQEADRIKLSTFRAYVRSARKGAGIKPLKSWTRRVDKANPEVSDKTNDQANSKGDQSNKVKTSTQSEFRDMGGEL